MPEIDGIYKILMHALRRQAVKHDLMEEGVVIRCRPLTPEEAIGDPRDRDYPIIKGREAMVEAAFRDARGQAFSDAYGNADYTLKELLERVPATNRERADFVAALNAVFRCLGLCEGTVHCKNDEPPDCARELASRIDEGMQVLLVGFQPRMVEFLSARNPLRVLDLDADHIGAKRFGTVIEGPEATDDGMDWCHLVLVTGSTLVNGTLPRFLKVEKPVVFYGVTIAAAAVILKLDRYCFCGR